MSDINKKPMTVLRATQELTSLLEMLNNPRKSAQARLLDVGHTAQVVEFALDQRGHSTLNHLAMNVVRNLIISKPEVLHKAGMFDHFYRFFPDPVMLGELVSSCMTQTKEGAKEREYCPVTIAEHAIELGAIMQWRPGAGLISSVHDHVLKSMTQISSAHRLLLIRNVVDEYCNLVNQIYAEQGSDDEMPYSGYLEDARNMAGQSGLLALIEQVQVDDPAGLFALLETHGEDLADIANYGEAYYLIRDIVIKQGTEASKSNKPAKRCAELEVLNAMSRARPGWYERAMGCEVIQGILIDDLNRKGVAKKVCDLPYSEKLDEIFCLEAACEGLVRNGIDKPTMQWLEAQWKSVGGEGTLKDAAFKDSRVADYLECYAHYVTNLDKTSALNDDENSVLFVPPGMIKGKGLPDMLESLYINENSRVSATPERRKTHLMHALHTEDAGMLKWAMKISFLEFGDKAVVRRLCSLSNPNRPPGIESADKIETYNLARTALLAMVKSPQLRPWLADVTYEVYQNLARSDDAEVIKGLRRINWKDDNIKSDVLETGMNM